jgi:hypothetical protein
MICAAQRRIRSILNPRHVRLRLSVTVGGDTLRRQAQNGRTVSRFADQRLDLVPATAVRMRKLSQILDGAPPGSVPRRR